MAHSFRKDLFLLLLSLHLGLAGCNTLASLNERSGDGTDDGGPGDLTGDLQGDLTGDLVGDSQDLTDSEEVADTDSDNEDVVTPPTYEPITGVTQVAFGVEFLCVLADGRVYCMGNNSSEQLGYANTTTSSAVLLHVPLTEPVASIAAGARHACAVTESGKLFCWGDKANGRRGANPGLDLGLFNEVFIPSKIALPNGLGLGEAHTCAIFRDESNPSAPSEVSCWGDNRSLQLGVTNDPDERFTPKPVEPVVVSFHAIKLAAANNHTCALGAGGEVSCWGDNTANQLGMADAQGEHYSPADLMGSSPDAVDLAAGVGHVCVIRGDDRHIECWGDYFGQCVDSSGPRSPAPGEKCVFASDQLAVRYQHIAVGEHHQCAIQQPPSGPTRLVCSGTNEYGDLGFSPSDGLADRPAEDAISYHHREIVPTHVFAGQHATCITNEAGALWCFGRMDWGLIGNGQTSRSGEPVLVELPGNPLDIHSAGNHTCARVEGVESSVGVYCWGENWRGQLGTPSGVLSPVPVQVVSAGLDHADALTVGEAHSCALYSGQVWCWGDNQAQQLGHNISGTEFSASPLQAALPPLSVSGSTNTVLSAGRGHSCVCSDGSLYCWGSNYDGELGDATLPLNDSPRAPRLSPAGVNCVATELGGNVSCVLDSAGEAHCWGRGEWGQLGSASPSTATPMLVSTGDPSPIVQMAVGSVHSCAVDDTNALFCWGDNNLGELGIQNLYTTATPTLVTGHQFSQVETGYQHTCAIESGVVYCWGDNAQDQCGTTADTRPWSAKAVPNMAGAVDLALGREHSCAIADPDGDGTNNVYCWGTSAHGQLGQQAATAIHAPTPVVIPAPAP